MARIFSPVESHSCDYGVDFYNGVAVVPDEKTDVLRRFENKGYTVIEGNDEELTEVEKLPSEVLKEMAGLLDLNQNATKAALLNMIETQRTAIKTLAKTSYSITDISVLTRTEAVADGQPTQVNDGKFTVAIDNEGAPIYNITFTVTGTLEKDLGGAPYEGKWIGVCLTLAGITDITDISYSKDGINFGALELDETIDSKLAANSIMYYFDADVGSTTRYIKDADGIIYTLNFAIATEEGE